MRSNWRLVVGLVVIAAVSGCGGDDGPGTPAHSDLGPADLPAASDTLTISRATGR